MNGRRRWVLLLASAIAGCATGHEPNGCSDLHVAVDGGATIRLQWDSGCEAGALSGPYRDRPASAEFPRGPGAPAH